ncbi:hypothetical protein LCGC14_0459900 [marine sediment metagenome]|uniref:Uncharacterized protein n=1 Tax=marine sediment metagenome TaxID=412755 RepID=A0A0F9SY51_9ZZZZ|nr:TIR domain-containing protein [bacterium]
MSTEIFIGYSLKDKEVLIEALIKKIQNSGFNVKSELSFSIGDNIVEEVADNINTHNFGFIVISKNFLNMNWKKDELEYLRSLEKTKGKLGLIVYNLEDDFINDFFMNISKIKILKIESNEEFENFQPNEILEYIIELYKIYTYENEDNLRDTAEFEDVTKVILKQLVSKINILIFTAIEIERITVLKSMEPLDDKNNILRGYIGSETYFIGKLGVYNIALTMCEPGSSTRDGIILTSYEAFSFWKPKIAILCGIAFGFNESNQKIGDILISKNLINYEIERVGTKTLSRAPRVECSSLLLNRFRSAIDWEFKIADNLYSNKHFGLMLSGEKLIDNITFRNEQLGKYPEAIGGDMEAGGLYASASRKNIDWIVIKSICDWASGKSDKFQILSAEASVSLIFHLFSKANVFEGIA